MSIIREKINGIELPKTPYPGLVSLFPCVLLCLAFLLAGRASVKRNLALKRDIQKEPAPLLFKICHPEQERPRRAGEAEWRDLHFCAGPLAWRQITQK